MTKGFLSLSYHWVIFLFSIILVGFYNDNFWISIFSYAYTQEHSYLLIFVIFLAYVFILALAMEILSFRLSSKYLIGLLLIIAGISQYFMKTLDITMNNQIIESLLHTNVGEMKDFLSLNLFISLLLYIVLPIGILSLISLPKSPSFLQASFRKLCVMGFYLIVILGLYFSKGEDIVFAFKSSDAIIYTTNPIAAIRSSIHTALEVFKPKEEFKNIALDATLSPKHLKPEVFVLVIGESARAKNSSLNGYDRDTNPYTSKLDSLINFRDFYSCGVITAISIPCMLTNYTHKTYTNRNQSLYIDNILDIAQRAGYETYWISNNGGGCMGGVCDRIKHIIYYNQNHLDGDMLPKIKEIIQNTQKDSFIVINLHGSHGPLYFQRYPKEFEKFLPVCEKKDLQKCSYESIVNAYDNSLIYTDYFVYQVIKDLKKSDFSTGLWYLSDHGESLGEYKQYMHGGLPYPFAPDVQKHIPSMIWLGKDLHKKYFEKLAANKDKKLNQDFLFHTLLELLDIKTTSYEPRLDITQSF